MAYEKQGFQNGEELTAEHLERIEEGIVDIEKRLDEAVVDENGNAKGDINLHGRQLIDVGFLHLCEEGKDGSTIQHATYEAIDDVREAAVVEFYGTKGDEKVRLRHLADGVLEEDAATVGQLNRSVGGIEAALDAIIAIQEELMGGRTITFYITGTEFTAIEGMTWVEWCDSDYNTAGYICRGDEVGWWEYNEDLGESEWWFVDATPSALIIAGYDYDVGA